MEQAVAEVDIWPKARLQSRRVRNTRWSLVLVVMLPEMGAKRHSVIYYQRLAASAEGEASEEMDLQAAEEARSLRIRNFTTVILAEVKQEEAGMEEQPAITQIVMA